MAGFTRDGRVPVVWLECGLRAVLRVTGLMTLFLLPLHLPCRRRPQHPRRAPRAGAAAGTAAFLALALTWASGARAAEPPTGLLWHNDFSLDLQRGVQVSPLDGSAPITITDRRDMDVAVWPDGKVFAVTQPDVYRGVTALVVMEASSGRTLHRLQMDGYVRDLVPSPASRQLVKLRQGEKPSARTRELVLDLATQQPAYRIADDDFFAWMPDGRFMLINLKTGRMRIARLDRPGEQAVGQLTLPPDRAMGQFAISPTGTEFIMKLQRRDTVPREADLWIGRLDGSGFEPLTEARAIGAALWSPDGRHIAYTVDTGAQCNRAGCLGSCEQRYTPATLRRVRGVDGMPGSARFEVRNRRGQRQRLGCDVLAWTR